MVTPRQEKWLALALLEGITPKRRWALLEAFGGMEPLARAGLEALGQTGGLTPQEAALFFEPQSNPAYRKTLAQMAHHGLGLLALDEPDYPPLLAAIHPAPLVLYQLGTLPPGQYLAVVGTRHPSPYAVEATRRLIGQLARQTEGLVVVSGLARGIDTVAHQEALALGLKTVAVLASGLDKTYPPENRELARRIQAQGALISEYPPGHPPLAYNFPVRNRIIMGISHGVVVAEAGEKSGALITAGFAVNHGRPVFAFPADLGRETAKGTNRLIQSGQAWLLTGGEEIAQRLALRPAGSPGGAEGARAQQLSWADLPGGQAPGGQAPGGGQASPPQRPTAVPPVSTAPARPPLGPDQARLLELLRSGPGHPDELSRQLAMPVARLLGLLLEMELSGDVRQQGDRYGLN